MAIPQGTQVKPPAAFSFAALTWFAFQWQMVTVRRCPNRHEAQQ